MSQPQITSEPKPPFPKQKLDKPGLEADMEVQPRYLAPRYKAAGKLQDKVALITGGDSGIGRAVAVLYAREGANVAIAYLPTERADGEETKRAVELEGRRCVTIEGDLTDPEFCRKVVDKTVAEFGQLDILVSNAAHQNRKESLEELSDEEFDRTFKTNVYAYFRLVKASLPHLRPGASIIVTGSETGFEGPEMLPDYSATKGRDPHDDQGAREDARRAWRSRELRCTGAGLDAAESGRSGQSAREGRELRREDARSSVRVSRRSSRQRTCSSPPMPTRATSAEKCSR